MRHTRKFISATAAVRKTCTLHAPVPMHFIKAPPRVRAGHAFPVHASTLTLPSNWPATPAAGEGDTFTPAVADGGDVLEWNGYRIHALTDNGVLNVLTGGLADILLVGGGGSGGSNRGGGGGAGGVLFLPDVTLSEGSFTAVIGYGGASSADWFRGMGIDGQDSWWVRWLWLYAAQSGECPENYLEGGGRR